MQKICTDQIRVCPERAEIHILHLTLVRQQWRHGKSVPFLSQSFCLPYLFPRRASSNCLKHSYIDFSDFGGAQKRWGLKGKKSLDREKLNKKKKNEIKLGRWKKRRSFYSFQLAHFLRGGKSETFGRGSKSRRKFNFVEGESPLFFLSCGQKTKPLSFGVSLFSSYTVYSLMACRYVSSLKKASRSNQEAGERCHFSSEGAWYSSNFSRPFDTEQEYMLQQI